MSKTNKNNTKSKLIPELRFPEFKDAPQWEVKELGEVMDYEQPSPYLIESTAYSVSGTPVLTANKSFILGYTEETTGIYDNIPAIIFDDFTTDSKFVNFPFKIKSSAIKILKAKKNNNLSFLFYTLSKISYQAREHQRHYISQFQPMNIPLPSLPEQERIGEFFSVLDSLIQAQSKEVQLLRLRKKGLMQKMFPYEGETTPEWRFPEFKDAPEWEVKELGEVGSVAMCRRIFKHETIPYSEEAIPFYKIGTFGKKADAYIPADLYHDYKQRYPYPKKGDVLISASGTIGRLIIFDGKPAYFQDSNIVWIKHNESDVLNSYLLQALSIAKWQSSDGGVINRLYNSNLLQTTIPIPSLAEQDRIGALFSTLDSLIEAKSQRLEQLKKHKKGLMQQLFP